MEFIKNEVSKQNSGATIDQDFLNNIIIGISTTNSLFSNSAKFIFDENMKSVEIDLLGDKYNLLSDFRMSDDNLTPLGLKVLDSKNTLI
jgi:hypothetical protein